MSFNATTGVYSLASTIYTDDTQLVYAGNVDLLSGQKLMVFDNTGPGVDISSSAVGGAFSYTPAAFGVGTTHAERFEVQSSTGVPLLSTTAVISTTARETAFDTLPANPAADSIFIMSGARQTIDLSAVSPTSHNEIDRFDLGASSASFNTLRLSTADVLQGDIDLRTAVNGWAGLVSEGRHQMVIDGGAGNTINMTDGTWLAAGSVTAAGQTYAIYNTPGAQLLIDTDLTRTGAVI